MSLANKKRPINKYNVKNKTSSVALASVVVFSALVSGAQAQTSVYDTAPPKSATAMEFIEVFGQLGGAYPGFRKAHAKGVCAVGTFSPNTGAQQFADSALLSNGELPAQFRFSLGGSNPAADERIPGVRGIGVQIALPDGTKHTVTGNSAPVFNGKDPETFLGFLRTLLPGEDGKVDRARTAAYIKANPSTQASTAWARNTPAPASWVNTPYFGLHTFYYQGQGADKLKYRWHLSPDLGHANLTKEQTANMPTEFLEDKLIAQLKDEGSTVSFTLVASIGQEEDTDIDPSIVWPEERVKVTLGTLTLNSAGDQTCKNTNFDPNIISKGFSPSADRVLRMRSPAYGISFGKRLSGQ